MIGGGPVKRFMFLACDTDAFNSFGNLTQFLFLFKIFMKDWLFY